MRRTRTTMGLVGAVMIGVLAMLAACGTSTSTSTSPSTTQPPTTTANSVCEHVTNASQALSKIAGIGDNTTVGDIQQTQQKLAQSLDKVAALPGTRGAAYDSVKSFSDQLGAAVSGMDPSQTVGQAGPRLQTFKAKATLAQAAIAQLSSALKCSVTP